MNTIKTTVIQPAMKIHEAAYLFPEMTTDAFLKLKEDIRINGQQVPIIVQNGYLLDGRARYRACRELGITPILCELPETNEPIERLLNSLNFHRRHLEEGQRAMIAARMANSYIGGNQYTPGTVSQKQAALDLKVSVDSLQRAKSVLNLGSAELIKAVDDGQLNVSNAAVIATLPEHAQNKVLELSEKEILEKAKALRKAKTEARRSQILEEIEAKRANNKPLDPRAGPYNVILADPPWDYMGEVAVGYPTMTLEDICAMPVNDIAAEDAVLFLWCSASLIREALAVIDAWGFTYKTQSIWDKMSAGQGCYVRVQHEILLIATRGKLPEVPPTARPGSVFTFRRREHSRKPDYCYEMIESMYPELSNKIELFCRGIPRKNWNGFGNECITDDQILSPVMQMINAENDDVYFSEKQAA
ncbi:S-adenosylmethionine-binding protein [Polynucleobacter sp. SHI8]|uniref:MT-A70 family methyltransferase n=1 Tax=unclassified Polynucleobacter TaxID=2640945 RepID=UPI0024939B9F|nr:MULTISPECIES: MT-A70 family methyltransferase [unclassified Polynucleobacter]BDW12310.1 S-adenosylmethionine-binding protein [Polynucleobacter sp. SHI2]BDW14758.1 S-adenosylmethionine-binding protein [Polynucleobacter sp. SHI8]